MWIYTVFRDLRMIPSGPGLLPEHPDAEVTFPLGEI